MASPARIEAKRRYVSILTAATQQDAEGKTGTEEYDKARAELGRRDLFYLLIYLLNAKYADNDWVFARCREVQHSPDGHLDLWAREHFKSTILTFALTIQDILNDPELTVGIFSHTRGIAKGFLRQIKREFESNDLLKALYPDVLWSEPSRESPSWSEESGIIVRRSGNPKEATVEAWGVVDSQPTSRHFGLMVFDDMVTRDSVKTPEQIKNTTESWETALNLGIDGGRVRYIGTKYHYHDTYADMIERGTAEPRIYPATENGEAEGVPVLMTRETLAEKRRDMGPYTFGCQMLLDPKADETQGFRPEWIRYYKNVGHGVGMNKYILVDPASEKKKSSDYTALWVVGLGSDDNYYVLDMVRDRLSLTERADLLFEMHRKWSPHGVGYERYGLQADVEHMRDRMEREQYRFEITELGGAMAKADRIRRLIPLFEQGRVWFPHTIHKTDYQGVVRDLVQIFVEQEYKAFPLSKHDDMLDALARITDERMHLSWPKKRQGLRKLLRAGKGRSGGWMGV